MKGTKYVISGFLLLAFFFGHIGSVGAREENPTTINIGVLARRGVVECLKEWSPTAQYLTERLPGIEFKVVPLNFREISPAVENNQVDFVIVNPYIYVELQNLYGVSRMVTLKRLTPQGYTALFGGSIFCRADHDNISSIDNLKGHSFAAVDETSFGGWMVAWRELKKVGVDPYRHFTGLKFGGTHDDVVFAVRDGKVDAGTVATPILAQMIAEGKIAPDTFKILNRQEEPGTSYGLSTRLYPEWPFAKLKHTPDDIAEKIAIALLAMPKQSSAATAANSAGWTVPFDYTQVQTCMQELQVGIYKGYGKITLTQMFIVYRWQSLCVIAVLTILTCMLFYSRTLNQRLQTSELTLLEEMQQRLQANKELSHANKFLKQSQQELANIIDFLPDATFVIDKDKKVITWNRAMEEMTGVSKEEMIGQGDYAYTVPFYGKKRKQLLDLLDLEDDELKKEYLHVRKKGSTLYAEAFASALYEGKGAIIWATCAPLYDGQGNYVGAIESIRDITSQKQVEEERKKLQDQLIQAQKMESVGQLAGGVAHEFNNMLGVILGHAEMAMDQVDPTQPLYSDLEEICGAAWRSADITRQLLAFARKQNIAPKLLDINETIEKLIKMLRRLIGENIDLLWRPIPGLWLIKADPSQIDQILTNLCVNARDSITGVGRITIETGNSTLDDNFCAIHAGCVSGEYVQISVSDTGSGIDKLTLAHIFEPFFTTKGVGQGTGLGLSMVYGAVKQNNGFVDVTSEPGQGTIFKIYLPRYVEVGTTGCELGERGAAPAEGGRETILLVEDEQKILKMTTRMLQRLGYSVLAASSPGEAIRLVEVFAAEIHLLITDVIMPEMNGRDLAEQLMTFKNGMKCLFMSGYTSDIIANQGVLVDGMNFIQKPFSQNDLAVRIRKVLNPEEGTT